MTTSRRHILLTGASGIVGASLISALLDSRYTVIATTRSQDGADRLAAQHSGRIAAGDLRLLRADLANEAGVQALLANIDRLSVPLYGVINNARSRDFLKVAADGLPAWQDWLDEFAIDVVAPAYLGMKIATRHLGELRRIVNIGSIYGSVAAHRGLADAGDDFARSAPMNYSAAKGALIQTTRDLAVRLARQGATVNCVAFGGVAGRADPDFVARYADLAPARRMLAPADLPGAVLFLLSESAGAMTGQTLMVDGGWTIW